MLPTNRSAIALAQGARTGALIIQPCGREDGVEHGGELGEAVLDEVPEVLAGVLEVHGEIARLLGEPGAGGVGGDAEDVDWAGGVFDDEKRVEPDQCDGVEVETSRRPGSVWA